jgi:hypothetical protein
MKKNIRMVLALLSLSLLMAMKLNAHPDDQSGGPSQPGSNIWNQAQEPTNWWNEIKQAHGHVGPWNVLGWRMGKAALRELGGTWGRHELDIICYIPLKTPYSCLADGLVVGTGNSIGRLDIRLGETMTVADIHVTVRRKDGTGPVLLFKPDQKYLEQIGHQPDDRLAALSSECSQLPEGRLFVIERLPASETGNKP